MSKTKTILLTLREGDGHMVGIPVDNIIWYKDIPNGDNVCSQINLKGKNSITFLVKESAAEIDAKVRYA